MQWFEFVLKYILKYILSNLKGMIEVKNLHSGWINVFKPLKGASHVSCDGLNLYLSKNTDPKELI